MKTRYLIGMIALVTVLLLSACTAAAPATQDQAASGETTTESESMDEESMDEESMDEESMDEESMDEESMDEESMDEESMDEESMDEESMDEESMDEESMDEESMDEESMDEESMGEESMDEMMGEAVTFTLTIENISDGSTLPSPLAPGAYAVHTGVTPLFVNGQADQGMGLEALAEDGDPSALAAALGENGEAIHSGAFNTPDGADGPGPLLPGAAYSFDFKAAPGEQLSFASMFVQSNDIFFAPDSAGITLFDEDGNALSGDVTEAVLLWDAGTETNEEPGVGENQAPRQAGPNTGDHEMGVVRLVDDMYAYPATGELIRVTLTAHEDM